MVSINRHPITPYSSIAFDILPNTPPNCLSVSLCLCHKPYFNPHWHTQIQKKKPTGTETLTMFSSILRSRLLSSMPKRSRRLFSSDLASNPPKEPVIAAQTLVSNQAPAATSPESNATSSKSLNFLKYTLVGALTGAAAATIYASNGTRYIWFGIFGVHEVFWFVVGCGSLGGMRRKSSVENLALGNTLIKNLIVIVWRQVWCQLKKKKGLVLTSVASPFIWDFRFYWMRHYELWKLGICFFVSCLQLTLWMN